MSAAQKGESTIRWCVLPLTKPCKKCDEQREGDSCHTCRRLQIECLGWGARRPDWMRVRATSHLCPHLLTCLQDKRAVEAYKAEIKAKLTRAGLIRGQPRSSIIRATSSSSSTVFATEQYQVPTSGSTISPFINDTGAPNLAIVDTTQAQGQGESPMLSMFGEQCPPKSCSTAESEIQDYHLAHLSI